jgi:L-lysine exporter family protein LysE/ArgO
MITFIEGLLTGFAFVMPIGAQNVFLISSSIRLGAPKNLLIATYVLLADFSLALICFFGIGHFVSENAILKKLLSALGVMILFTLAYQLIKSKDTLNTDSDQAIRPHDLKNAFLVTYANPQALIDGALIYGALRASYGNQGLFAFFAGNMTASIIWFIGLSLAFASLRHRISTKHFKWIEKICAGLMVLIAIKIIYNVFILNT